MALATRTISITVPDIGDFTDVPIVEVLVKAGDVVNVDDPWGLRLSTMVRGPLERFCQADARDLRTGPGGSTFVWRGQPVALQLAGHKHGHNRAKLLHIHISRPHPGNL